MGKARTNRGTSGRIPIKGPGGTDEGVTAVARTLGTGLRVDTNSGPPHSLQPRFPPPVKRTTRGKLRTLLAINHPSTSMDTPGRRGPPTTRNPHPVVAGSQPAPRSGPPRARLFVAIGVPKDRPPAGRSRSCLPFVLQMSHGGCRVGPGRYVGFRRGRRMADNPGDRAVIDGTTTRGAAPSLAGHAPRGWSRRFGVVAEAVVLGLVVLAVGPHRPAGRGAVPPGEGTGPGDGRRAGRSLSRRVARRDRGERPHPGGLGSTPLRRRGRRPAGGRPPTMAGPLPPRR